MSVLCTLFAAGHAFAAQQEELDPQVLAEMNVTALGYEKSNLETPADVTVYTSEDLKKTGASDVANALKYKAGVYFTQMGPHGQNWITNSSKATLRGVDNGTLVLINGVPASFNGVSHLDNINLDTVEKVEVVKGGGAVLYGSEAFGGVINVITKKANNNNVSVAAGNNGQRKYSASVNANKLNVFAAHDELGATDNLSVKTGSNSSVWANTKYLISFGKSKKDSIGLNYNFNDNVSLNYNYTKKDYSMNYNGVEGTLGVLQHFDYDDAEHRVQAAYNNKDFSSVLYYNYRSIDNPDTRYQVGINKESGSEWEKSHHKIYGFDVKQKFGTENDRFLLGADFKHELYDNNREKFSSGITTKPNSGSWNYNNYSVYGQYDKKLSDVTSVILSAREDIAKYEEKTYHEFLPQAQIITKVDDENAVYASVGKSFRMPNFRNLYYSSGMIVPNPDLKPEKGINYEVGYKFEADGAKLNIAAFRTEVKDQIVSFSLGNNQSKPDNVSEFKNTGVEINYNRDLNKHFSYNLGAIFSNPQRRYQAGQEWSDALGRYQLNGGVNYDNRDFEAALNVSYWGSRVTNGTKGSDPNKTLTVTEIDGPLVVSNLHIGYKLRENMKLTFDVDNLFNRKDICNVDTSSSQYYTQGRTFLVGMNYSF